MGVDYSTEIIYGWDLTDTEYEEEIHRLMEEWEERAYVPGHYDSALGTWVEDDPDSKPDEEADRLFAAADEYTSWVNAWNGWGTTLGLVVHRLPSGVGVTPLTDLPSPAVDTDAQSLLNKVDAKKFTEVREIADILGLTAEPQFLLVQRVW